MKSYDRVEHYSIWAVMEVLRYDPHLTMLVKGLVEKAMSKVHMNGRFTKSIDLERGVRQGSPLSSLLFIISTQPLMLVIHEQVALGELKGICIGPRD